MWLRIRHGGAGAVVVADGEMAKGTQSCVGGRWECGWDDVRVWRRSWG